VHQGQNQFLMDISTLMISNIPYVNFKNTKQFKSCSHLNQFQVKMQLIMLIQLPILFSNHHQISQTTKHQKFPILTMVECHKKQFQPFSILLAITKSHKQTQVVFDSTHD